MTNSKKLILISILELLIANAYGVEVDRGAAAVSALLSIAMVMTLSILAFQLIAYKITRKTIATPIENGRWIGAWFASLAIASSGNFYDGLTAEYFYRLSQITIPLLLVGFVIGFAWKKFRGNTNKKNDKKISSNANIDERLWEQADAELNSDNRKSGLWAKSYSEAQGDESKAKALYLSYRASELQYENTDEEVVVVNKNSSSTNKTTIGVVQDYAEAVRWYKLAAAQGDAKAQYNLGVMYDNGRGVVQDYAEAVRWYKLAAAQGYASAQSNLGVMYAQGQGVLQNNVQAHMWFNIAAVKGDKDAVKNRDIAASKMTTEQIAQAQRLAKECQARNYKNCE